MSKVSFSVAPYLSDLISRIVYIEISFDEWTDLDITREQCFSGLGNEIPEYLAWQPINEEIMC